MPHPSPLRLSCSLGVALLAAACSHVRAQPFTDNPYLSPEVNAALADPQLPVRKYRGDLSGWTKRFETCISTHNPYAQDQRLPCMEEEISGQLAALDSSLDYLLEISTGHPIGNPQAATQRHQQWLAAYASACPIENSKEHPYARQQCLLDGIDDYRQELLDKAEVITSYRLATAAEAPPAAHGSATLILGDARITVSVDACPGVKSDLFRACENVRLAVSTPDIAEQHLQLPEVIFSDHENDTSANRGTLEQGFAWGKYSLMLLDLNNDGHEDLMAWTGFDGSYGDPSYTYFLYDADAKAFVENTAIQALIEMHSLSRVVDGQFEFWYRSGPCERGEKSIRFDGMTPQIVDRNDENSCKDDPGES